MVQKTIIAAIYFLIIYATMSSYVDGQTTPKPRRISKFAATAATATTTTTTTESGSGSLVSPTSVAEKGLTIFKLFSNSGATCISMKTDAIVQLNFLLHGLPEEAGKFIPSEALVDGICGEDESTMAITWRYYKLELRFAKLPGGERWYISNVELTVSPDLPELKGIETHGKKPLKLYNDTVLIPTPVGRSYHCDEINIELKPHEEDHPPRGLYGSLSLRLVQMQPFMYKSNNALGAPYECKREVSYRDETAPIAVGSTLAIAVLLTIAGYGVFRYFKVKNVQYNTME